MSPLIPLAKATAERARLAAAQADLAEFKATEQRGLILDAAEVGGGMVCCAAHRARRYAGGAVARRGAAAAFNLTGFGRDRQRVAQCNR